ncbi:MAG: hypothetical protein M3Z04_23485 [Chloroflexota bacterium]|nr:hypothetical protein [Chloroflexota bacterium]
MDTHEHYSRPPIIEALLDTRVQLLTSRVAFQTTVTRVLDLLEADDNEADYKRPNVHTVAAAERWLNLAYAQMDQTFPKGAAVADEEGGVRIYWQSPKRNVQLVIPDKPGAKPWIYQQEGKDYSLDREVSPEKLAYWLNWLAQE